LTYAGLVSAGVIKCSDNGRLARPAGEHKLRCVCNDGFVGNGLQCIAEGDTEIVEVVEEVDPSKFVKMSFEIESNSTITAIGEMTALTSSCASMTCEMDTEIIRL